MDKSKEKQLVNVTSSGMSIGGHFANYQNEAGDKIPTVPLNEVRASLVYPSSLHPGFTLIMGQKHQQTPTGLNSLLFLSEYQTNSFEEQIHRLAEEVPRLKVRVVYCDQSNEGLLNIIRRRLNHVRTPIVPYINDIEYGKVMVSEWLTAKALEEIPKDSILHNDLMKMSTSIGNDVLPSSWHALRYLIGGFQAYRPHVGSSRVTIADCGGWT